MLQYDTNISIFVFIISDLIISLLNYSSDELHPLTKFNAFSMKIQISHSLETQFGIKVYLKPQVFRFIPFTQGQMKVEDMTFHLNPTPKGISTKKDIVNNTVHMAWFRDPTDAFRLDMTLKLDIKPFDPEDFVVHPREFLNLNFHYSRQRWHLLVPYLETIGLNKEAKRLVKDVYNEANNETLTFIYNLNKAIHKQYKTVPTSQGEMRDISDVLKSESANCVELSSAMIHMLRTKGIAARFVSGYILDEALEFTERRTWVQVYVPGPGWMGLDPCSGKLADYKYIPVAAGPNVESTTFRWGELDENYIKAVNETVSVVRMQ